MRSLRAVFVRMAGLFRGGRRDRGLVSELDGHLQFHIDDNLRAGMTPEEARREAMLKLGGIQQTTEAWRDRRRIPAVETIAQDIRYAVRALRKAPGFGAAAFR